ncbi:lipocalin family protein [Winogradskyella schleiferi]|uniref:lipocalin family protein n=1 Tax=Winogradskyella schleiferi TaxID=2686078 RepID=UPI0015B909FD|nr:lipocalin family protein [Winogradskyella schleiferi]
MKKFILGLFVLTSLSLTTACSSDDDDNTSSNIEGAWKLTAWNVSGSSYDLNNDGTASTNLLEEMNCYNNETIVFNNNVATYMTTSYADIYAELVAGSTSDYVYTIECQDEVSNSPASYSVNGNTVTITTTYEEDGTIYEVILLATLNGNTLSFVLEEGLYIEENVGFDVIVEQDLTLVFTKL